MLQSFSWIKGKYLKNSYITKMKTQMSILNFSWKLTQKALRILESDGMDASGHINNVTESKKFQKS